MMRTLIAGLCLSCLALEAQPAGKLVNTPYSEPKAVFDFYFEDPRHINSALYWVRAFVNPLTDAPYDMAPEFMDLVVVIHGTEIVTVVEKNYETYRDAVDRMRYYASLGVRFRVCRLAAEDYGYKIEDFQDFIEVVPSAMTELVYWQQQGYGLVIPQMLDKKFTIEEIQ